VAEIATTLGVSDGTVKTHLHRGRAALARLLDDRTEERDS
jgi:DNA-directed RNA polymerase specialized sigma24 family protein